MRLSEIPDRLDVGVTRDGDFASLGFVTYETDGLLVFVESAAYVPALAANERITAVLTTPELAVAVADTVPGAAVATAASPRAAFYGFHNFLATETAFYWQDFPTEIDPTARVHPRAFVAERNVRIGPGCVVEPNATILERVLLAEGVVVRAGCVLGGEGFQFAVLGGRLLPVKHVGGVRLDDGVELQATTCVDLAIFGGFTVVGEETKTDNRVHIAHNCRLGRRNRLAAATMLAGSVVTGDDVWFGPSCAVSDGVRIGEGASITIGAVVTRDVPAGQKVSGNFAIDHDRFMTHIKAIR